jgi:hypothetical protein
LTDFFFLLDLLFLAGPGVLNLGLTQKLSKKFPILILRFVEVKIQRFLFTGSYLRVIYPTFEPVLNLEIEFKGLS